MHRKVYVEQSELLQGMNGLSVEKLGFFSSNYEKLETRLGINLIQNSTKGGNTQALVIVPSSISAFYLKRRLKLSGVRFLNFKQAASSLGKASLINLKRQPVPFRGEECIARQAIKSILTPDNALGKYRNSRGFPGLLMSLLKDFRQGGFDLIPDSSLLLRQFESFAEAEKTIPDIDRIKTIAELHNTFRQHLAQIYFDVEDIMAHAGINAAQFRETFNTTELHIFGFAKFDEIQKRMIERVAEYANTCIYVPWLPENPLSADTIEWLSEYGFRINECRLENRKVQENNLELIKTGLFRQTGSTQKPSQDDESLMILSCPDALSETVEIARQIIRQANTENIPFENMAVIVPDSSYSQILADVFSKAEIPAYFNDGYPMDLTPSGKCLKLLLNLIGGKLERFRITELLNTGRVKLDSFFPGQEIPIPAMWDYTSKKAGIRKGKAEWEQRLESYCRTIRKRIDNSNEENISDDLKSELTQAEQLLAFIGILSDDMQAFEENDTWTNYTNSLINFYNKYIQPDDDSENIVKILYRLTPLGDIEQTVTFDDFRIAVKDILETNTMQENSFMQGAVNVLSPKSAAGTAFDSVFITGMQSGVFPKSPTQNPLLPDDDRIIINKCLESHGKIALRSKLVFEDPIVFAMLATSCRKRLTMSFSRNTGSDNKPQAPSPFITETGRALTGKNCLFDDIRNLPGYKEVLRSFEYNPNLSYNQIIEKGEYTCHRIKEASAKKQTGIFTMFENYSESFRNAVKSYRNRKNLPDLSVYEGIIQDQDMKVHLLKEVKNNGALSSPTSIENFFRCPYRFFFSKILKLRPLDSPESIKTISPMDKGNIYHKIYYSFYKKLKDDGISLPSQQNRQQCISIIREIAGNELKQAEQTGITGSRISWFREKTTIMNNVATFVDFEIKYNCKPRYMEFPFGSSGRTKGANTGRNPISLDFGNGNRLNFYGRIDRIDVDEDQETITVIDYKTGSSSNYCEESLKSGEQLQLFLYMLFIDQALPKHAHISNRRGYYYFATEKGKFKKIIFSEAFTGQKRQAESFLLYAYNSVKEGIFTPWPGKKGKNCEYCDFSLLCPQDVQTITLTKKECAMFMEFADIKGSETDE